MHDNWMCLGTILWHRVHFKRTYGYQSKEHILTTRRFDLRNTYVMSHMDTAAVHNWRCFLWSHEQHAYLFLHNYGKKNRLFERNTANLASLEKKWRLTVPCIITISYIYTPPYVRLLTRTMINCRIQFCFVIYRQIELDVAATEHSSAFKSLHRPESLQRNKAADT